MNEYRCTMNSFHENKIRDNICCGKGYHIIAINEQHAICQMALRFPHAIKSGFSVELWKDENIINRCDI